MRRISAFVVAGFSLGACSSHGGTDGSENAGNGGSARADGSAGSAIMGGAAGANAAAGMGGGSATNAGGGGGAAGSAAAGSGGGAAAGEGGATGAGGSGGSAGQSGSGGTAGTGGSTGSGGARGTGGATGSGGAAGSGGSTGSGGAVSSVDGGARDVSGLPTPPGGGVSKPSGAPGGMTVLNWAGFQAAVSFTFDDSQPSQIAHYAELQAVGIPMTFYICDGNQGLAMFDATWAQAAKDGHEIGNHTAHHCQANLTGCSFGTALTSQADEINSNTSYITSHYAQSAVWTMASPFGDTGWDTAAQGSVFLNRGVGGGTIAPNDTSDPFNLPIHLAATGETAATFNGATDSAHSAGRWLIVLIHTITPTTANWFNPVAITDVTAAMGHAKSLPDVWTDTVVNIGAYWRAQKLISALTPTMSAGTTTWTWTLPPHFPPGKFLRIKVTGGTLSQRGSALAWNDHGYYEVALDPGSLTLGP